MYTDPNLPFPRKLSLEKLLVEFANSSYVIGFFPKLNGGGGAAWDGCPDSSGALALFVGAASDGCPDSSGALAFFVGAFFVGAASDGCPDSIGALTCQTNSCYNIKNGG